MFLTWGIDTAELHDDDLARVPMLGMAVTTHQVPEQTPLGMVAQQRCSDSSAGVLTLRAPRWNLYLQELKTWVDF